MLAIVQRHRMSIFWIAVVLGALLATRALVRSESAFNSLMGLLLFFTAFFYFIRGMEALQQIATRLERIEHVLRNRPTEANPSTSTTAT